MYVKYRSASPLWSYSGFLVYLGVDRIVLERVKRLAISGDESALAMLSFMHKVQYEYYAFVEELMVYQYAHPAMRAMKVSRFDFGALRAVMFSLRKQLREYDDLNISRAESQLPSFENVSEVKLLDQELES